MNAVANSTQNGAVVDWMKTARPDAAFAALDPSESLAEGIGSGYPIIGYKGKIWSIRERGNNHLIVRPDDGTPAGYLDVVILRQAPIKAKSYYLPGEYEEQASAGKRPICASIDGVRPDPDVQAKQADLCATCSKNEWHKDKNGKNTRDCADYKRMAVFILPYQTVRLFGQPLMDPAFLRVPPASLQALATYGDNASQQGWHYSSFITRITFDPTKAHPEFQFKALQPLSTAEASTVLGMRNDLVAQRITGEDEIERRKALPAPAATAPAQHPAPRSAPSQVAQQKPVVVEALPNPSLTGLFGVAASTTQPQVATPEPPKTMDLPAQGGGAFGFTPVTPPPGTPAPGAAIGQSAEDVGEVAEDNNLDALIAAMLPNT